MKIATPLLTRRVPFSAGNEISSLTFFEKLHSLTSGYSDFITREYEKNPVSLTEANLANWAKHLSDEGKHEPALEIYEWMEKNKMTFSPSVLANFVGLVCERRGIAAGQACFKKLDPDFDITDSNAKNWPAYGKIFLRINGNKRILIHRIDKA